MTDQSQPVSPAGGNSIVIELLRTGTPHNQTLSPGVTYLALCGSHPPAEFRIDLEQYKFTRYIQLLRYKRRADPSSIQLAKEAMQEIITGIFEAIPALHGEANSSNGWLHLHLVMTPRELSMLPFELALTPNGFQGARMKAFLVNPLRLTTLTREVRQVTPRRVEWPAKPRILFAWAAPEQSVPAEEHVASLQAALQPWARPKSDQPAEDYGPLLTVLPTVRLTQLRAAVEEAVLQEKPYTHVHLLAHGVAVPDPDNGPQFALALHLERERLKPDGTTTSIDLVDGEELADALLVVQQDRLYYPTVVTIAACDGGNEGTILLPGGSMAQVLHQSGIPYVLASQFPLSVPGSIRLIDSFYPRLLHGEDPRTALYYARKAVNQPEIHDWASLVAYARFPDDFDEQLEQVRLRVALEMMKAANQWTDFLLNHGISQPETLAAVETRLRKAIIKLTTLLKREPELDKKPARAAEHYGLLGSAHKRLAEYQFRRNQPDPTQQAEWLKRSRKSLEQARTYYQRGHDVLLVNHWTGVQYLSLTAVVRGTLSLEHDRWCVVQFAAERDLAGARGQDRAWALGTLAELYLLKPLTAVSSEEETANAFRKAGAYLDELAALDVPFEHESTARQLARYIEWWPEALPSDATNRLRELAKPLRDRLPALGG